jgi:acyl dehydratase
MREIATIADLAALAGHPIGTSEWLTVDQQMIDDFAQVTGDRQWIHVDVERARREAPGGHTVAHGFLTLSLLSRLQHSIYRVVQRSRGVNYGLDRVRFVAPVVAGARIRLHLALDRAEAVSGGTRFFFTATVEIEGSERPALVAQTIAQLFD